MKLAVLTPAQLRSIERTLSAGTWTITFGAVLFSVLTVTPLVQRVTSQAWDWTAPILPIVVDAAVVIVVRLDATVSRLGEKGGRWPDALRWLTGVFTLALNIGDSALKGDLVGVAVHAVAPMLLIFTAEAALSYRRAITRALDRIAREQADEVARERRERETREQRERSDREAREQREREDREQERAAREHQEREAREHELRKEREQRDDAREQREWEASQERERADREERLRREHEDRQRREQEEREARVRQEREAKERLAREEQERERQERERVRQEKLARREHPGGVRETAAPGVREQRRPQPARPSANTPTDKLPEAEALAAVASGVTAGTGVRELSRITGWSVAWVSERAREAREQPGREHPDSDAGEQSEQSPQLVGTGVQ
ncbi:DUF2637 domain-containing protein [Streptomyces sp. NBC_00989]|uniref:DUF2637 domain-containing protein n=1 Tax=Streptomyces sp. NBC_00989 TaxID=2903705 RepID=UPI0038677468|nr:DUF2637 domain-containing protein [Streptomyces sp. NBC_00989]